MLDRVHLSAELPALIQERLTLLAPASMLLLGKCPFAQQRRDLIAQFVLRGRTLAGDGTGQGIGILHVFPIISALATFPHRP